MRTLKFDKNSIEYVLLHRSTLESSFKPSPAQYQDIANIQKRFESVGKPNLKEGEEYDASNIYTYHTPKATVVVFEEAEFTLLKAMFEQTQFANSIARFVADTKKLLDSAEEEKPVAKLKKL